MNRTIGNRLPVWVGAWLLVGGLAACSQQAGTRGVFPTSQEEKSFSLTPDRAPVKAAFLTGELQHLRVSERVKPGTNTVTDPPWLHGTLWLKNGSADLTARLIGGRIEYVDSEGKPIPLAKDRRDTSFTFATYPTDRLDPGMETSQAIEVPFPAEALAGGRLREIRLEVTYAPQAYKEETVTIPVSVKG